MRIATFVATLALAAALPAAVEAMPLAQPIPLAGETPVITLTSGGCGFAFHRGPFGGCRPNFYGGYGYGVGYRRFGYGYGWHRGWHRW